MDTNIYGNWATKFYRWYAVVYGKQRRKPRMTRIWNALGPSSLAATLAALPSISLIPSVRFKD